MKIINEPCLPYQIIGQVIDDYIDDYINNNYEDTCYVGKVEVMTIDYKDNSYKVQIRYLKRYVEWRFMEYEKN